LKKWYGKKAATKIKYAEAFETADFCRQITQEEVFTYLPMLERSYVIDSTKDWVNTGIEITKGEVIEMSAEGRFVWKREGRELCGPDGADVYSYSANKPMPAASTGALIARIGTDAKETFLVGSKKTIVATTSGRLYLGINDDKTSDNDGEYRVWVKRQQKN